MSVAEETLIERITATIRLGVDCGWTDEEIARSVVSDMRKPTEAMMCMGAVALTPDRSAPPSEMLKAGAIYSAMIDAASSSYHTGGTLRDPPAVPTSDRETKR